MRYVLAIYSIWCSYGKLNGSVRTIVRKIGVLVPGISQVPSGQFQLLTYSSSFRKNIWKYHGITKRQVNGPVGFPQKLLVHSH